MFFYSAGLPVSWPGRGKLGSFALPLRRDCAPPEPPPNFIGGMVVSVDDGPFESVGDGRGLIGVFTAFTSSGKYGLSGMAIDSRLSGTFGASRAFGAYTAPGVSAVYRFFVSSENRTDTPHAHHRLVCR